MAKEERPPAPSPAAPGVVSVADNDMAAVEPSRSARPVLELRRVEVRGLDRKVREVQVVIRRKFSRGKARTLAALKAGLQRWRAEPQPRRNSHPSVPYIRVGPRIWCEKLNKIRHRARLLTR